jgi:hypothetical protein
MTIALGLVARDGLVLAADTQETIPGYWKHEQGKIWECGRALLETPTGGGAFCLIAGSGHAAHVDGISRAFVHRFNAEPYLSDPDQVQPALALELETFYARHVLPFAAYPQEDRPSFQVILGYLYTNVSGELLTSEDNLLQRQSTYAAVGIGASLAKTLLRRWYQLPLLDVWQTTLLASYVMYLVKESIDGCGKHTDLVCLNYKTGLVHIDRKDTVALENIFADYAYAVEPKYLRSVLNAPPPNHVGSLAGCRRKLRRIIDAVAARTSGSIE